MKTMTILINPLHPKNTPPPAGAECLVRGIMEDETVFKDSYFPSLAAFASYALRQGWRERFKCVVCVIPHPADRRKQ